MYQQVNKVDLSTYLPTLEWWRHEGSIVSFFHQALTLYDSLRLHSNGNNPFKTFLCKEFSTWVEVTFNRHNKGTIKHKICL